MYLIRYVHGSFHESFIVISFFITDIKDFYFSYLIIKSVLRVSLYWCGKMKRGLVVFVVKFKKIIFILTSTLFYLGANIKDRLSWLLLYFSVMIDTDSCLSRFFEFVFCSIVNLLSQKDLLFFFSRSLVIRCIFTCS